MRGNGACPVLFECGACGFCDFFLLLVGCCCGFDVQLIPALCSRAAQLRNVLPDDGVEGVGFLFEKRDFFLEFLLRFFISMLKSLQWDKI